LLNLLPQHAGEFAVCFTRESQGDTASNDGLDEPRRQCRVAISAARGWEETGSGGEKVNEILTQ
jgi:hypothetical protein